MLKKLLSLIFLCVLVAGYQNCAQSGAWTATLGGQQLDQGSQSSPQTNTNYPAKSVEELQSTCSLEKENLDVTPIRPLSTYEYVQSVTAITGNQITSQLEPLFKVLPQETAGDSISTYIRFTDARAFLSDDRIAGYHRVALQVADAVENASNTAASIQFMQMLFNNCYTGLGPAEACINIMVKDLGRRAYHRPLTQEQFDKVKAAMVGGSAEIRLAKAAYIFLMSPYFLLHMEEQGDLENGILKLDQYALITKISYFLTGGPPSNALLDLAEQGKLSTEAEIGAAADNIKNGNYWAVRNQMNRFLIQWLGLRQSLISGTPKIAAQAAPTFNPNALPSWSMFFGFPEEVQEMFHYYLIDQPGSYKDFFTTDKSFTTNSDVASVYGTAAFVPTYPWSGVTAPIMTPATHKAYQRAGFLTAATMLVSGGEMTNPFAVGGNIYKHVLCRQFGDTPLPNFQPTLDPKDDTALLSTRERFEKLVPRGSSCMKCHSQVEAFGMPMQDYDIFGRHREGFEKIYDSNGNLLGSKPLDTYTKAEIGGQIVQIRGGYDMVHQLAKTTEPQACFARQLVRFASSRLDSRKDSCLVLRLAQNLTKKTMWDAIKSFLADPAFAKRRISQ